MKKHFILIIVLMGCIVLFSCCDKSPSVLEESQSQSVSENQIESVEVSKGEFSEELSNISSFSYTVALTTYIENEPGVKTKGFNNTTVTNFSTIDELTELAKNEVTIEYNKTNVYYDSTNEMFLVVFYTDDLLGGYQSVYIDKNGATQLIVYGE